MFKKYCDLIILLATMLKKIILVDVLANFSLILISVNAILINKDGIVVRLQSADRFDGDVRKQRARERKKKTAAPFLKTKHNC